MPHAAMDVPNVIVWMLNFDYFELKGPRDTGTHVSFSSPVAQWQRGSNLSFFPVPAFPTFIYFYAERGVN